MNDSGLRDRKKQQTRAALTEAALRLVDERGLDAVTVEDISAAADVSPRTFFNYFATKDEALIGDHTADDAAMRARFLAADPSLSVIEALLLAAEPVVAAIEQDREIWRRRIRVMTDNPQLVAGMMTRSARSEHDLIVAIASRVGVAPESGWPLLAAFVTGAAVRSALLTWAKTDSPRTFADHVHEAFGALAAGLPDPSKPDPSKDVR
ncbi:TetR/AcrR family transcriptional regulator [Actinoplanes sp. NPDC051470]|uniref:TetR/AcrR family transcriptional regulator n=1 Tax=Actinoplanes sp. NPDC051470 TaxID=3157224 RepID=UPI0034261B68